MAKVVFKSAISSKTFGKNIEARILADFAGTDGIVSKIPAAELTRLYERITNKAANTFRNTVVKEFNASLDEIIGVLEKGEPGGLKKGRKLRVSRTRWQPFSKPYISHKKKHFPGTEDSFWLRSGALKKAYRTYAKSYKQSVRQTKSLVELQRTFFTSRGKVFRFRLSITLPKAKKDTTDFLDVISRQAFLKAVDINVLGSAQGTPLDPISYIEGAPGTRKNLNRPFMSGVFAKHGNRAVKDIIKNLRTLKI